MINTIFKPVFKGLRLIFLISSISISAQTNVVINNWNNVKNNIDSLKQYDTLKYVSLTIKDSFTNCDSSRMLFIENIGRLHLLKNSNICDWGFVYRNKALNWFVVKNNTNVPFFFNKLSSNEIRYFNMETFVAEISMKNSNRSSFMLRVAADSIKIDTSGIDRHDSCKKNYYLLSFSPLSFDDKLLTILTVTASSMVSLNISDFNTLDSLRKLNKWYYKQFVFYCNGKKEIRKYKKLNRYGYYYIDQNLDKSKKLELLYKYSDRDFMDNTKN